MTREERIAEKPHLCECCHRPIDVGEKYADYYEYYKMQDYWQHYRFHLGCDVKSEKVKKDKKLSIEERLDKKLAKEGRFPVACDGIKYWLCGINYDERGNKFYIIKNWEDNIACSKKLDYIMKNFRDENGKLVI